MVRGWREQARDDARTILQSALNAVQPQVAMRKLRRDGDDLVLPDGERVRLAGRAVRLVALGKAAGMMAAHAQPWGPFAEALVSAPCRVDIPGFEAHVGGHPLPDDESVRAGERALDTARVTGPDDLLIVLLSGGASAMAEAPDVPLADLRRANELLLASSAPIGEINTVRRHLSRLKGGGLARACRGEILLLAISDVDDLAALGSGPACADPTTFADALDVLRRRGVLDAVPGSVRGWLEEGAGGTVGTSGGTSPRTSPRTFPMDVPPARPRETVKPGDPSLARVRAHVLADNDTALRAAAQAAARLGYDTRILSGFLGGEARERGRELGELARVLAAESGRPIAIVAGGETTVRVEGRGKGGRNQELALAAVDSLSAMDALLAAFGTDGIDGPTDAAGAIVDGMTRARADAHGLDAAQHLQENDAYPYFEALDDLIRTGPTGTNVRDIVVLLVRAPAASPQG